MLLFNILNKTSTEVAYVLKMNYHTSFQYSKLNGASFPSTSQVRAFALFFPSDCRNLKITRLEWQQMAYVHTKFCENRPICS
jgi:hypothetical protein